MDDEQQAYYDMFFTQDEQDELWSNYCAIKLDLNERTLYEPHWKFKLLSSGKMYQGIEYNIKQTKPAFEIRRVWMLTDLEE